MGRASAGELEFAQQQQIPGRVTFVKGHDQDLVAADLDAAARTDEAALSSPRFDIADDRNPAFGLPMNRRYFLRAAAVSSSSIAFLQAAGEESIPRPKDAPEPEAATAMAPTDDGISIVWGVHALSSGHVEYGSTPELGKIERGAREGLRPLDKNVIVVPLTGLKPGATLYYRTVTTPIQFPNHYAIKRGESIVSEIHKVVLPGPTIRARIVMWQDTHDNPEALADLRRATTAFSPNLLMLNGDLVGDQFTSAGGLYHTCLGITCGYASLDCAVAFSRGNHEVRGVFARDLGHVMPRPNRDGWYHFLRCGSVAVITLDSGEDKPDSTKISAGGNATDYGYLGEFEPYRELQKHWLEALVRIPEFSQANRRIAFSHIPLRWKDATETGAICSDGAARWTSALATGKVAAVFSGHTHRFWHDEPGTEQPFHQICGGGPSYSTRGWTPPTLTTIEEQDDGLLRVRVVEARSGTVHMDELI